MSDHRYYIVPVSPVGKKKKELAEQIRNYMLEQGWIYPELQEVFYYGELGYTFTNKGIIEFVGEKMPDIPAASTFRLKMSRRCSLLWKTLEKASLFVRIAVNIMLKVRRWI